MKKGNPVITLAIVNLALLIGLIVFVVFIKQKQQDGKIGYFFKKDDTDDVETIVKNKIPSPAPPMIK